MNLKSWLPLTILIFIASFPLFSHLSELNMQRWDEARLAVSAFEMSENGKWLIPYYNYSPDNWSLKPPLLIWFQALSIKTLGANVLATRLPVAIAALFTCIAMWWFLVKLSFNRWLSMLPGMILVVLMGYVRLHGSRTGDYDVMLALFTTLFLLYYYLYLQQSKGKYLLLAFVALSLAALTKGIAAMLFVPMVAIFTLLSGQLKKVLSSKQFYVGIGIFLFLIVGYYLLREHYQPGYIKAVSDNELGGRFNQTLEGHYGPWYFYFNNIFGKDKIAVWAFLAAMPIVFMPVDKRTRNLIIYITACSFSYLLILSFSATKLDWYSIPVYPLIALQVSLLCIATVNAITHTRSRLRLTFFGFFLLIGLATYGVSYRTILQNVTHPQVSFNDIEYVIGHYLKLVKAGEYGNVNYKVTFSDFEQEVRWYTITTPGIEAESSLAFQQGDTVITHKEATMSLLARRYDNELVEEYFGVRKYAILGIKDSTVTE